MAIRILFLFFGFMQFCSYSQDSLATDSCLFYMPNTISPDCENYGCQFLTFYLNCDLEDYKIVVYNKWGELLHESTDRDELWDPHTILKETTYLTYQVTGKVLQNGALLEKKWQGHITFLV